VCGAPTVAFALTGVTATQAEFTTMEYAMDAAMIDGIEAKLTAESGAMTYDFPSDGKNYMLAPATVTATYFSAVDTTADAGSFAKTYGGSAAAATK